MSQISMNFLYNSQGCLVQKHCKTSQLSKPPKVLNNVLVNKVIVFSKMENDALILFLFCMYKGVVTI